MADISFEDWAKKIRDYDKNPMKYIGTYAKDMIYAIHRKMAELQVPDTGQSRALIVKKIGDRYGKDLSKFESEIWDEYGNRAMGLRNWENTNDSLITETITGNTLSVKNEIKDTERSLPLRLQNEGVLQMSETHPRGSNKEYIFGHIDWVIDKTNAGHFEETGIDEILDKMEEYIAKEILHGRIV